MDIKVSSYISCCRALCYWAVVDGAKTWGKMIIFYCHPFTLLLPPTTRAFSVVTFLKGRHEGIVN